MNHDVGERLIHDLLTDPDGFEKEGRGYELLQSYFGGLPPDTLRPLFRSKEGVVQRTAAFIASELGTKASELLNDVVPLMRSADGHVQWYAMEILTVCSTGEHAGSLAHVVRMLECEDGALRRLAMRLISRTDLHPLEAAKTVFETQDARERVHAEGLGVLAMGTNVDPSAVTTMLADPDALRRRYGAIAAARLLREWPALMDQARSSEDRDISSFCESVMT